MSVKNSCVVYCLYELLSFGMQMGQTPLHVSAGYNKVEIIKHLLDWPGPEKVELEAKNMVCRGYFIFYLFDFFLNKLATIMGSEGTGIDYSGLN